MNPEETEECLIDPKRRIIKQITVSDAEKATQMFRDLMGKDTTIKKKFIEEHGKDAEIYV